MYLYFYFRINILALSKKILAALMVLTSFYAMGGQINTVSVTSKGFGVSEPEATTEAVINGIAQVNGESIASSMRMKKNAVSASGQATKAERTIDSDLSRRTQGVVRSWKKVSSSSTAEGYTVTVVVDVVVMKRSDQLKRLKLAIVSSHPNANEQTQRLVDELTGLLTSSRKFAVLDRRQGEAIQQQLDRIKSGGGSIEDRARLSAEVAPDFIAVTSLNMVASGGKQLAEATIEIIDYSSRQVKFHEKKTLPISSSEQTVVNKRIRALSKSLFRSVMETVYPPIIVGKSDDGLVTIAQGSDFFNTGDKCVVKEIIGTLKDPHTKEFLGYNLSEVGTAEIVYTDKRLSQAKLSSGTMLISEKIADKKYFVARTGESTEDVMELFDPVTKIGSPDTSAPNSTVDDDY